ncbi:MAG: acylphosphatase [Oligoflexia bacterium]|nr:acylphosphatase [Oligoflexia bacterium]
MIVKKIISIKGKVQGVGYRNALRDEAKRLGVTGWVRNKKNGTVEAFLHGESTLVFDLIEWAKRGPALAIVDSVDILDADSETALEIFLKKPTE